MIQTLAFYLFAAMVVASGALVIFARNPVHSVLWLILAFFNAAGLMLLCGAEFIAMLLIIVVGSLWIMANMNYNMHMSPEQIKDYMIEQNKKGF